jgi:hypothetical protein
MLLTSKDFDVMIGDYLVRVESMSASITDNRKVVMEDGIPVGHTNGEVSCSGEIELNLRNAKLINNAAKSAGSWRELEPFDIGVNGSVTGQSQSFDLYGCLITISDLFSLDPNSNDQTKVKFPFNVTSPDFVDIDGVPYLSKHDTRNL